MAPIDSLQCFRRLIAAGSLAFAIMATSATAQMSDVDFDILSARMAKALMDGDFEKALPMIGQIKNSGREYTPSLIYFEGFALENTGRIAEAEAIYRAYLQRAGKSGAYYKKALSRIIEIETQLENAAREKAEKEAAKARADAENLRKETEARAREAAKRTQPGGKFKDCDVCPEMVVVPTGSFQMGSPDSEEWRDDDEGPQRAVTIPNVFAIGTHEVTHGQIGAFVRETGYSPSHPCKTYVEAALDIFSTWEDLPNWPNASYTQSDQHPAVCIGKPDVKAYAAWLSKKTGEEYRLPTEAEWEYAARAGTRTAFYYGNDEYFEKICAYGNTSGFIEPACTNDGYRGIVAPTGKYRPNKFGLYDVIGNAAEWVEDCYADTYATAPTNGAAYIAPACKLGVVRGSSYDWEADNARSAARLQWAPERRWEMIGFRVARDVN